MISDRATPTLQLARLEALAKAAREKAPGPWLTGDDGDDMGQDGFHVVRCQRVETEDDRIPLEMMPERVLMRVNRYFNPEDISPFIAACDPNTILALIERVRELERSQRCPR